MQKVLGFVNVIFHPFTLPMFAGLIYLFCTRLFFEDFELLIYLGQIIITTMILPSLFIGLINNIRYKKRKFNTNFKKILYGLFSIALLLWAYKYIFQPTYNSALLLYFKNLINLYILWLIFLLKGQKTPLNVAMGFNLSLYLIYLSLVLYKPLLLTLILSLLLTALLACHALVLRRNSTYQIIVAYVISIASFLL